MLANRAEGTQVVSNDQRAGGGRLAPWFANIALALSSTLAFGGIWWGLELALRFRYPRGVESLGREYVLEYSDLYGWQPRANFRWAGPGPLTSINRGGYRGAFYPHERSPGKSRVVMLGDSITFGYGVADGETFSDRLGMGGDLEIVNLGVQGYGTDQELLKLEAEALRYQPDLVIVNFCVNDFRDNAATRAISDGDYPKPFFTLEGERLVLHHDHLRLSPLSRAARYLGEHSLVFNWFHRHRWRLADRNLGAAGPTVHPDRPLTFALLRSMKEVARRNGVRLVVLAYPTYRDFLKPSRRSRAIVEAEGVEAIDLLPYFKAKGFDQATFSRYALDGTPHLTSEGHGLTAQIIADLMSERGWLLHGPV